MRLTKAGFARDDINVSKVGEPSWREFEDDDAQRPGRVAFALRCIAGIAVSLLVSWVADSAVSSFGTRQHAYGTDVTYAIGVFLFAWFGVRFVRFIARTTADRFVRSTTCAEEAVVSVRVTESLSRYASRILERSGAKYVSMD